MTTFDERSYWEGRLAASSGLEGVGFKRLGESFNRRLYRLRREVFLDRVRAAGIDVGGAEVLDVGSGTGFYVDRWHELGAAKVTGIDLTDVAVSTLRQRFPND